MDYNKEKLQRPNAIGQKRSKETRKRMSKAHIGIPNNQLGKKRSKETRKKISESRKGIPLSKETRKKISKTSKGRKLSEEHKKKIGSSNRNKLRLDMVGSNNYNWCGGKSFEPYPINWTEKFRRSIRKRDKYICQIQECCKQQTNIAHSVHHIDYNKSNCNPSNLITLCFTCHMKTNHNRKYWTKYFNKLIKIKYNMNEEKKLISLSELAKVANVNKSKLQYYVSLDLFKPIDKIGGTQIFDKHEVLKILNRIEGFKNIEMTLKQIADEIKKK